MTYIQPCHFQGQTESRPCRQILGVTESQFDEGLSVVGESASRMSASEKSHKQPVQDAT